MIREFIPPIAKKIMQNAFPKKTYPSYAEAHRAASQWKGYDNEQLIDVVFNKTQKYILEKQFANRPLETHHLFLLSLMGQIHKPCINVLDFGGAFGTHYFIAKHYFPKLQFNWKVIELPEVVNKAKGFVNEELQFIDLQGDFGKKFDNIDLVITSGTLQHLPDPYAGLGFLCNQQAPFLALLRLGLHLSNEDLWLVHKARVSDCGPGLIDTVKQSEIAAFSFCLMSSQKLSTAMKNYALKFSTEDLSGTITIPNYAISGVNQVYFRNSDI